MKEILNKIYDFCKLNDLDTLNEEIERIVEGYKVIDISYGNDLVCYLADIKNDNNKIIIRATNASLSITKSFKNKMEHIFVNSNDLVLRQRIIEKRSHGLSYSRIDKHFTKKHIFDKQCVLDKLIEQKYIFNQETLKRIIKPLKFENEMLERYFIKFSELIEKGTLKSNCDYYTEFLSYMNKFVCLESPRLAKDNKYSTRTFLNGEEISDKYDIVDGYDKLSRIYDLYNGVINERNERDICAINLGFLKEEAYGLKEALGITLKEDLIIGHSLDNQTSEYIDYLKELFNRKYNYTGEISLDRETIIKIITNNLILNQSQNIYVEEPIEGSVIKKLRGIFKRKK